MCPLSLRTYLGSALILASLVVFGCNAERRLRDEPDGPGEGCTPGEVICDTGEAFTCQPDGTLDAGVLCPRDGRRCVPGVGCTSDGSEGEGEGEGEGGGEGEGEGEGQGEGEGEGGREGEGEGEGEGECDDDRRQCRQTEVWFCLDESWTLLNDCAELDKECVDGACVGCAPGTIICRGASVTRCLDDGRTEEVVEICGEGTACIEGECVAQCGLSDDGKTSYQGCEYWAVDLDNINQAGQGGGAVTPADAQFAVVVSNVNDEVVTVTVTRWSGGQEEEVLNRDIEPGQVEVLNLAPRSQIGSGSSHKAYRISSSKAVIAYQFNPLNNTETAYSNDASLLIPSNALGERYVVVTGDGVRGGAEAVSWGAYVTVVGVSEDPTTVTIEAATDIDPPAGAGIQVNGRTVTATLERYQLLSVHGAVPPADFLGQGGIGGNMSGTQVTADKPVAVFSGNLGTVVPSNEDAQCCADHLEEQMWPVSAWGKSFVAARSLLRRPADPVPDHWRVTGSVDNTRLSYFPARPTGAPDRVNAGQSIEFVAPGHFVVLGSQPILLTQFLTSSFVVLGEGLANIGAPCERNGDCPVGMECDLDNFFGAACNLVGCAREGAAADAQCTRQTGYLAVCFDPGNFIEPPYCAPVSDPSMVLVPPVEQYREDYVFLTPLDYQTDFINIMAPAGASVTVDGRAVAEADWVAVAQVAGDGAWNDEISWRVATLEVGDGRHEVRADAPVGVAVYGYDKDVSYGYPGGLNLERIND